MSRFRRGRAIGVAAGLALVAVSTLGSPAASGQTETTEAPTTAPPTPTPTTEPTTKPTTTITGPVRTKATIRPTTTTVSTTPGDTQRGFAPFASLVARGLPRQGIFFPLRDPGFLGCLPLELPCVVGGLVLVPARAVDLRWESDRAEAGPDLSPAEGADVALRAFGVPPGDRGQDYAVAVLALGTDGGIRRLPRRLADGSLVAEAHEAESEHSVALVAPETFDLTDPGPGPVDAQPFDKPYLITTAGLTEAAPVVAVVLDPRPTVVYALRINPAWKMSARVVPLIGPERIAFLVRAVSGPPGLLVAAPAGLVVAPPPREPALVVASSRRGSIGTVALVGVSAALALAVAVGRRRMRRRTD